MNSVPGELSIPTQKIPTRYRGVYEDALLVRSAGELDIASTVLVSGLDELKSTVSAPPAEIDYEGYALIFYPEPTQEFDFNNPEATKALQEALKNAGFTILDDPGDRDDYVVHPCNCIDWMDDTQDYFRTAGLTESSYLLAPVVREKGDEFSPRDVYGQYANIHIMHGAAVRFSGIVLLEALVLQNPELDEDRIPVQAITTYINSLTAKV